MSLTIVQAGMGGSGNPSLSFPSGTGTVAVQGLSTNIVSGTAQASTSGTAITFTGIPSYAKRITVMIQGIGTSTGTSSNYYQIQIGSGSLTTTGYASQLTYGTSSSGAITTGFVVSQVNSSYNFSGVITLVNINGNTWMSSGIMNLLSTSNTTYISIGYISLSGVLDRVSVTTNGGFTLNAGTINILYE